MRGLVEMMFCHVSGVLRQNNFPTSDKVTFTHSTVFKWSPISWVIICEKDNFVSHRFKNPFKGPE